MMIKVFENNHFKSLDCHDISNKIVTYIIINEYNFFRNYYVFILILIVNVVFDIKSFLYT